MQVKSEGQSHRSKFKVTGFSAMDAVGWLKTQNGDGKTSYDTVAENRA